MAGKNSINVTVQVNESQSNSLSKVASDLKRKGFILKESLDAIGILTGSIPAVALSELNDVPGVVAVEEERTDYRTQD